MIKPVAFSPDGRTLLVGTWNHDALYAWDAATGRLNWRVTFATRTWADLGTVAHTDPEDIGFAGPNPIVLQPDGDGREWVVRYDVSTGKEAGRVRLDPRPASGNYRFSGDGTRVAVSGGHNLAVYDTVTGRRVFARRGDYDICDVDFSPDAGTLAVGDCKGGVHLLRTGTGQPVRDIVTEHEHSAVWVKFALGGRAVVVTSTSRWTPVLVLDAATGAVRHRLKTAGDDGWSYHTVAVTPDGKTVLIGTRVYASAGGLGDFVVAFDAESGTEVRRFPCRLPYRLGVRPDGKALATGDGYTIELLDLPSGNPLPQSADPPGGYTELRPAPDGGWVGVSHAGVDRFDRSGRRVSRFSPPATPDEAWWGFLSPDGSKLARVRTTRPDEGSGPVEVWDTRAAKLLASFGREPAVRRIDRFDRNGHSVRGFSPDGRVVVTHRKITTETLLGWDTTTGQPAAVPAGWKPDERGLKQSPDGRWLAKTRVKPDWVPNRLGLQTTLTEVVIVEAATGREVAVLSGEASHRFGAVVFSPDSRLLAVAPSHDTAIVNGRPPESDLLLYLFEVPSGREVGRIRGTDGSIEKVAFSPDGRTLATGGYGRAARVYEVATLRERVSFPHARLLYALAFSADGEVLATSGEDAPVYLWDVRGVLARQESPPGAAALEKAWTTLAADDAKAACSAIRLLAAFPDRSVPYLKARLSPAAVPDPQKLNALIAALDSPEFAERERATSELEALGKLVEPGLRQAVRVATSSEVRQRLSAILGRLASPRPTAEELRTIRAVEAVEWAGSQEGVKLLESWATGAEGARLTEEAKAALTRLNRR
jgi:WD40 repeat protein